MKNTMLRAFGLGLGISFFLIQTLHAQTAPKLSIHVYPRCAGITVTGTVSGVYTIEANTNLALTNGWVVLTNVDLYTSPGSWLYFDYASPGMTKRFYRVRTTNMVLIPAGSFTMGDSSDGDHRALPLHTIYVSAFYIDKYEVTKALWDDVYNWAIQHGYSFDNAGLGKAANHPVCQVSWYDVVKWCNARSEKEGRVPAYYTSAAQTTIYCTGQVDGQNNWVKWNAGYRLPTEAEWEKAARGGASGHRFPWSNVDTITHSQANYYSETNYAYDLSSTRGYHPSYQTGVFPFTSPVGSFASNGYGLYDMAGNVQEWCWDWYGFYSSGSQTDPRGPTSGINRVLRGGCWNRYAFDCRVADRSNINPPDFVINGPGFRTLLPSSQ